MCAYCDRTGKVPKTSAGTPEDFTRVFDEIHSLYPDKLILHLAYYRMAPQVTRAIDLQPDALRLWQEVYDGLVAPCVELIKNGRNEEAYRRYKACALALHEKYVR